MLYKNRISKIREIESTSESYPFSSAKKYGYLDEARYDEKNTICMERQMCTKRGWMAAWMYGQAMHRM